MNTLIANITAIEKELSEIQSFTEETMSEDANEAVLRGNTLSVYMARTGKLLADAKCHKDEKLNSEIVQQMRAISGFSPSVANKYIDTVSKHENYLVNWAERLNRTCTHQLEWCRTVISKAKSERNSY